MKKIILLILALLFPIVIIVVYYSFYNMAGDNALCSFREITGFECPGCGGQRALHLLLHGDISGAFRHNAFFIIVLPFLAYFYYMAIRVYVLKQERYLKSFAFSSAFGYSLLISVILFFVLRNIPFWPFYYLAPPQ